MKRGVATALAMAVLSMALLAQTDLKQRADTASGADRAKYAAEYAADKTKAADKAFQDGKDEEGSADLKEVAEYAKFASEASVQSHKRQKETEIHLRKIGYRLTQIKNARPLDQQDEVKRVIEAVDDARNTLLDSMFDKKKRD